ncbi:hypothetical protein ACSBR2_039001 [Camellia fascicularis]
MHRIQIKKEGMEKYTGEICPNIVKNLEVLKVQARNCFATYCGDRKFEVDCGDITHIVDLEERKCSCRMWDLSGIPCQHAVSSIFVQREKPEDYVHPYYSKQHYLVAYNSMMHPVPRQHDWVETGMPVVAPLLHRKQPGKPPKMRKKGIDEPINPVRVSRQHRPQGHRFNSPLGPISWAKHCWLGGWTSRMPNQLLGVGLMLPRCASPDLIEACLGRSGQASRL